MKKSLFLLLILLTSSVLALQTDIKSSYQPGETIIFSISGNFLDTLKVENIEFYSGRAYTPLIYDLAKINDKFYIYAVLPLEEKNYTILIKDVHYTENGKEKLQDLTYNFSAKGNYSLFSVIPGFIIANNNFSLTINSNIQDITVVSTLQNKSESYTIKEGQSRIIRYSIDSLSSSNSSLSLKSSGKEYLLPCYILKQKEDIFTPLQDFRFSSDKISISVLKNSNFRFILSLFNSGDNLENITFDLGNLSSILSINPTNISKLNSGSSVKLNLTINTNKNAKGIVKAISKNATAEIELDIKITDIITNNSNPNIERISQKTCIQAGGKVCNYGKGEKCSVTPDTSYIDNVCCFGTCSSPKKPSNLWWIILVIIAILAGAFFFLKKLKLKPKTTKEVLSEKTENYEEMFKPKETHNRLTRI